MWTDRMAELEENFKAMQASYDREREMWCQQHLEAERIISNLTMEKEELIRSHTLESGDLRKKVSFLSERLEQATSAMTVAPSHASLNDFTSDMDNLNMGPADWDSYIFVDELNAETPSQQPSSQVVESTETSLILADRTKELNSEDKPAASGLLLMLLLFGAFVASKSSGTSSQSLPKMPDDVRAASAAVLESVYKDAGVTPTSAENLLATRMEAVEPHASIATWTKPAVFGNMASHLDQTFSQLAGPTKDQEAEALFSMTPQQYNSLTSAEFTRRVYSVSADDVSPEGLSPGSQPVSHRRNLAETLAAMREQSKGETAADVYTRSLLWDRVPSEVVREFKKMVENSDRLDSKPSQGEDEGMTV